MQHSRQDRLMRVCAGLLFLNSDKQLENQTSRLIQETDGSQIDTI